MELMHVVVLAVLQGFTEFLPISSSGHLILVPAFLDWGDQGLAFDIAVHFGSLLAVVSYFRADIVAMCKSLFNPADSHARLAWQLVVASVPLGFAGLFGADFVETQLRSPMVIAATTILFGVALWVADWLGRRRGSELGMSWGVAIGIGVAQAIALIPGTSRSGATMTAGLALGLTREAAGRFSFLLAIPAIIMAAGWQTVQLIMGDPQPEPWGSLVLAGAISCIVAFATIAGFFKIIGRIGMVWFALYRFALGALIIYVFA
jgi:undecaprenyl-diphosphatase